MPVVFLCTLYSGCWLVVKLGTPQDRRLDRSDERQKGDCERTKEEGEMSTLREYKVSRHHSTGRLETGVSLCTAKVTRVTLDAVHEGCVKGWIAW